MKVGILRAEYHIPAAHSLKEKRRSLKRLLERLRTRYHCDAAEVDFHDLHQRAAIGVALVAVDGAQCKQRLQAVKQYLQTQPEMQLLSLSEAEHAAPENALQMIMENLPHADT